MAARNDPNSLYLGGATETPIRPIRRHITPPQSGVASPPRGRAAGACGEGAGLCSTRLHHQQSQMPMPHRVMRMSDPAEVAAGRAGLRDASPTRRRRPPSAGTRSWASADDALPSARNPMAADEDAWVTARTSSIHATGRRHNEGTTTSQLEGGTLMPVSADVEWEHPPPRAPPAATIDAQSAHLRPGSLSPQPPAAAAVDALAAAGAAGLHTHAGYGKRYVPPPASAAGISLLDHPMSPAAPPGAADDYIYAAAMEAALSASERQARADASASAAAACRSNAQKHSHTSSTIFDDLNYPPARLL